MVEKISPVQSAGNQLATDFNTKCEIFLQAMYPKPPDVQVVYTPSPLQTHKPWPLITDLEIQQAIQTSSPKKAPGPDDLSFAIIQAAYKIVPDLFHLLYKDLIQHGYHPKC